MGSRQITVPIPIGLQGLYGSENVNELPINALLEARNISFESDTIQKEAGAVKYNSSAITGTPSILGGHDWDHDGSTQRMVVLTGAGALLKDSGAGTFPVTLKAGMTVSATTCPTFTEGGKEGAANNRKLFICTGTNKMQVLSADGATTADVTTPPTDWATNYPLFALNHENRIWAGGNGNDPHRLYFSTSTDHEDFTGAGSGSVAIFPGEGETLVNAFSFNGVIVCFKYPRGIYVVDTRDGPYWTWRVDRVTGGIGMAWVGAGCVIDTDIVFLDANGEVRALSATDQFGDVGTRSISDIAIMDNWIRDKINLAGYKNWRAVWYALKREIHFGLTGTGSSTNNIRFVFDIRKDYPRFRWSDRDTPISLWVRKDTNSQNLVMGEDAGFVYKLDQASKTKDGAYSSEWATVPMDMSHIDPYLGTKVKYGHFLEAIVIPSGDYNMEIDVYWDGIKKDSVTLPMGGGSATLGSFVLGTDVLGESEIKHRIKRIVGGGRLLQLVGRQSSDAADFNIARLYMRLKVADERIFE